MSAGAPRAGRAKFNETKSINNLRTKCLESEAKVYRQEQEQQLHQVNSNDKQLLNRKKREAGVLRLQLTNKILSRWKRRWSIKRSIVKQTSEQFRSFAHKAVKKAGSLAAVKDQL